ncbi:fluoride efflux transporter CrcB [Fulvivirga lutimaris]|uniref:fluoride efflux transporter CrcB n=1 Tax=Fulvivirga lutimaris TaxID=1819566 RepID=UPI0012BCDB57|nr:fluoride efflux transporter CrcB [Fulvivirga lutimaris]MTI40258.1 fluoride efflux transporter CrcB [Fulvivirga lutimaris]
MLKNIVLVGLGGFLGSTLRYLVYLFVDKRFIGSFPMATFSVNIIGSFLLGLLVALSFKNSLSESMRLLLAVGLCGSFTTFSTFAMENFSLLSQKELMTSFLYISLSVVIGLAAAFVGQWVGKMG